METMGIAMPEIHDVVAVFTAGGLDAILSEIEQKARQVPIDVSTPSGRKLIASTAHKIAKAKTALDAAGKGLVAEAKNKIAAVDAERRRAWDRLETLQHEIRRPLTEFEEKDKYRIEEHEFAIAACLGLSRFSGTETIEDLARSLSVVQHH